MKDLMLKRGLLTMALINSNKLIGRKVHKLKDLKEYKCTNDPADGQIMHGFAISGDVFNVWGDYSDLNEYEQALITILDEPVEMPSVFNPRVGIQTNFLTANLYNSYGERYLLSKYFEYYEKWDGDTSDFYWLINQLNADVKYCVQSNRYKWGNLMRSCLEEFDPLYNVDATEETTRTLEQDGTVSNQKSGTETSKKTGTETSAKSGTETSARTGTEQTVTDEETADRKTGTETSAKTGAEQISYDTEEKTDYDGSEATTHQKAETTTESVTTTESSTFFDTKKTQDVGAANDNVDTLEYSNDRADTLSKTGTETTSFDNRQDQTTYNTTDTITHDNEVTTTHNTQDQLTHNTTDQLTHNTTDQLTHNTTDLESRDLLDTEHILHRRYGNIGITMSTQLLESFRNFVNYNLIDIVAHDIANYITQGVY